MTKRLNNFIDEYNEVKTSKDSFANGGVQKILSKKKYNHQESKSRIKRNK